MTPDPHDTYLIYDGECPACRNYVRFVRFRDTVGTLHLFDARKAPGWVQQMQQRNMPLDDGMVLILNGRYFHGADAIHHMALLSSGSGLFNRINAQLFRSRSSVSLSLSHPQSLPQHLALFTGQKTTETLLTDGALVFAPDIPDQQHFELPVFCYRFLSVQASFCPEIASPRPLCNLA